MDEAANLNLSRGMLASLLPKGGRLAIFGDPQQLPAYSTDIITGPLGASESFMEFLYDAAQLTGSATFCRLNRNYRSREELLPPPM